MKLGTEAGMEIRTKIQPSETETKDTLIKGRVDLHTQFGKQSIMDQDIS